MEYFLDGYIQNQSQISQFIKLCKDNEDKEGSLKQNFFSILQATRIRFLNGPFSNLIFNILERRKKMEKGLSIKCKHCSERETAAIKAERESTKYMQIKYMQDKKETKFKGIISGITDWGLYVEIEENKCEGMVYIKDIKEDRFFFKEEEQAIIGRETEKRYRLGDEVVVMVKKTDLVKKHLDFIII